MRVLKAKIEKSKWVRIVFGSIALHLAALSVLSLNGFFAPATLLTDVVFVGSVSNSKPQAASSSSTGERPINDEVQSGTTGAISSINGTDDAYLAKVHQQILQTLSELSIGRSSSDLSMSVNIEIEPSGAIKTAQLNRSSGVSRFDEEVLSGIQKTQLPPTPNSQSLKLIVPIRLIK